MWPTFSFNRERLIRVFFFGFFAFLLFQTYLIARPFLPAILLSVMMAMAFYPLRMRLCKIFHSRNVVAFVLTLAIFLAAFLPLLLIVWTAFNEAGRLLHIAQEVLNDLQSGNFVQLKSKMPVFLHDLLHRIKVYMEGFQFDFRTFVLNNARGIVGRISAAGGAVAQNAIFVLLQSIIFIVSLFFMLRDGEPLFEWFLKLIPMEESHKRDLAKGGYETFRAVSLGIFLTAIAQGFLATIGFLIAGVRLPFLLGMATGFVSLLGVSFLVTFPVSFYLMASSKAMGIFLLLWSVFVVGMIDNFMRPLLIGRRTRMHFVLIFFSILGGLKAYGLMGVILGPLIVASVLTVIKIYQETSVPK